MVIHDLRSESLLAITTCLWCSSGRVLRQCRRAGSTMDSRCHLLAEEHGLCPALSYCDAALSSRAIQTKAMLHAPGSSRCSLRYYSEQSLSFYVCRPFGNRLVVARLESPRVPVGTKLASTTSKLSTLHTIDLLMSAPPVFYVVMLLVFFGGQTLWAALRIFPTFHSRTYRKSNATLGMRH